MTKLEYLNNNKLIVVLALATILVLLGVTNMGELKEIYYETLKASPDFVRAIRCQ